jgi:UPF0716 family protein affecting phage T7 exclusion
MDEKSVLRRGGLAGILTVVPTLEVLGAVFGLGFIVCFAWVGIVMLRGGQSVAYVKRSDQSHKRGKK